jgi:hypothetical protein
MELYTGPRTAWETPAYFSAADGGIEHSVAHEPELFLNSLVYNLLFEEGGLLVPDIFFFNCEPLIGHLVSSEWPLLGRAIGQGLIIPAFRSPTTESFTSALAVLGEDKILGIEYDQYFKHNTKPSTVANTLDSFVTRPHAVARRVIWPEDMGTRYAGFVRRVFENSLPDSAAENHVDMWNAVEGWRENCLTEAQRLTAAKGGTGIRRAEIFNALGHQLKILDKGREFDKPRQLLEEAIRLPDEMSYQRVKFFIDVVNVTYQRSQASEFGTLHNTLSPLTPTALSLFQSSTTRDSTAEMPTLLSIEVLLPSASSLLSAPTDRVLGARMSDKGLAYFSARSAWMTNELDASDGVLADKLKEAAFSYAKELRTIARGTRVRALISTFRASAAAGAAGAAIPAVVDYLVNTDVISPKYALLTGLAGAGVTSYALSRGRQTEWDLQVPRRRIKPPEVNLPLLPDG